MFAAIFPIIAVTAFDTAGGRRLGHQLFLRRGCDSLNRVAMVGGTDLSVPGLRRLGSFRSVVRSQLHIAAQPSYPCKIWFRRKVNIKGAYPDEKTK